MRCGKVNILSENPKVYKHKDRRAVSFFTDSENPWFFVCAISVHSIVSSLSSINFPKPSPQHQLPALKHNDWRFVRWPTLKGPFLNLSITDWLETTPRQYRCLKWCNFQMVEGIISIKVLRKSRVCRFVRRPMDDGSLFMRVLLKHINKVKHFNFSNIYIYIYVL